MKEHTTHYACDCVLNRLEDAENRLREATSIIEQYANVQISSPSYWIKSVRELLNDKLKGVHDGNVQSTRPPRKRNGVRLPAAVSTSHGNHRVGRYE